MSVQAWPSLHCLMPGFSHADVPDTFDTGTEYVGTANPYACSLDITFGMKYGLLRIAEHMPIEKMDEGMQSFAEYIADRKQNHFSHFDGGQIAYNLLVDDGKTIFWNGHLGGYSGILQNITPKPNIAILAVAGRANLDGRPFNGSAAQFAVKQVKWLDSPGTVIWCLHDQSPLKPYNVDTNAATNAILNETSSQLLELKHATETTLF